VPKHRSMKTFGEVRMKLYTLLTSAVNTAFIFIPIYCRRKSSVSIIR